MRGCSTSNDAASRSRIEVMSRFFRHLAISALTACLTPAAVLWAQATPEPPKASTTIEITSDAPWQDAGLDVQPGDTLRITASGSVQFPASEAGGPDGLPRTWWDLLAARTLSDANRGALIGRIGSEAAYPFLIGPNHESSVTAAGRLYLGINRSDNERPAGTFHVTIEIVRGAGAPAAVDEARLPVPTQALLDQIPARVVDAANTPGDRVNFVIVGSEEQVKRALQSAGWVLVDRSVKDAIFQGLLATLAMQSYTRLPMSELFLFGRPQDFGYAHADPVKVVASQHHFRLWKAPFEVQGTPVWAGAATHDIGFEKDPRNNSVTHKIDPDVDKEREYIASSLQATGAVAKTLYLTPSQAVKEARTAHGANFFSDGRTLVVILIPERSASEKA